MPDFDLAIRGGTVVTASDTFRADIGVRGGAHRGDRRPHRGRGARDRRLRAARHARRHRQPRASLAAGVRRPENGGRFPQPAPARRSPAATRPCCRSRCSRAAPACAPASWTTTRRPTASAMADYGFHLIITDPSPSVLGQELPALVEDGYTSFKVFMTYDDLVLNDRQLLEVFECARGCRALVMVHCEGYDAIKFMTERLEQAGKTAPYYHAVSRPQIGRARGDPPRDQPCRAARRADHDRARLGPRGDGADPLGAAARAEGLRRDLPAIHRAHRRRSERPQHGRERRQIRLLAAAARPRELGRDLGGHPAGRVPDLLVRPLPVLFRRLRGQEESQGAHVVPLGAERHSRASRRGCRSCGARAWSKAASRRTSSWR